jgi:hypothetical protein
MTEEDGEVGGQYPYPVSRLFVNVVTAGLAVFLMFMLVKEFVPLLLFVVSACLLTVVRFFVKIRYVFKIVRVSESQGGDVRKPLVERSRLVMLLGLVAIVVSLPLLILVTQVLPVYVWLTVMASVASGSGLSEVAFYVYCKRWRSEVFKLKEAA